MALSDIIEPYIPSMKAVLVFFFVVYIPLYVISIMFFRRRIRKTPFVLPSLICRSKKKLVTDRRIRDAVLRQHFNIKRVPDKIDVIIVGSNLSGMITASLLAKSGIRVLVLERHTAVGGKIMEKGLENDAHYELDQHFGNMKSNSVLRHCLDQVTNGGLNWNEIEPDFDSVFVCQNKVRKRVLVSKDEFQKRLIEEFPNEVIAIRRYFALVDSVQKSLWHAIWTKVLPLPIIRLLKRIKILDSLSTFFSLGRRSLADVLEELTSNEELIVVLAYQCYNMYQSPANVSFISHAFRMNQVFKQGAFYPVGGLNEIAFNVVPIIESAKGKVLVGAPVVELLSNEKRVTGVKVALPKASYNIRAGTVIIAEGICKAKELLQNTSGGNLSWLPSRPPSKNHGINISMQVWLDTCTSNFKAQNMYFFMENHSYHQRLSSWLSLSALEASMEIPPCFMLSCPSAKDPKWSDRFGENTSLISVNFMGSSKWMTDLQRTCDIKQQFFESIWKEINTLYLQLHGITVKSIDFHSSEDFWTEDVSRYTFDMQSNLRPDFGKKNLLLTGSDIFIGGHVGEIYSAILCASYYLNRNLMSELVQMQRGVDAGKV